MVWRQSAPRAFHFDAFALTLNEEATRMLRGDVRHFDLPSTVLLIENLIYFILNFMSSSSAVAVTTTTTQRTISTF